jgi:hypothetical protein
MDIAGAPQQHDGFRKGSTHPTDRAISRCICLAATCCKAQDREMPRPDHPGVPFISPLAQFRVAREAGDALVNN